MKNKIIYQVLIGIYCFFCFIMIICGTQIDYSLLAGGFTGLGLAIIAAIICARQENE